MNLDSVSHTSMTNQPAIQEDSKACLQPRNQNSFCALESQLRNRRPRPRAVALETATTLLIRFYEHHLLVIQSHIFTIANGVQGRNEVPLQHFIILDPDLSIPAFVGDLQTPISHCGG